MWTHWVSTYYVEPDNWIGQMYDSRYHGTWKASSWYKNSAVDELMEQARCHVDQTGPRAALRTGRQAGDGRFARTSLSTT
jgi:peptide/nickel transport system substrate-binding protein